MRSTRESATDRRRATARRTLLAAVALAVVLAGCIGSAPSVEAPAPAGGGSPTPTTESSAATTPTADTVTPMTDTPDRPPVPTKHPSLSSELVGLLNADDPAAYASHRGLTVENDSVRVVVELREGRDLPEEFDVTVQVRVDRDVQALVALGDLRALAEHDAVSFVRPPHRPVADDGTRTP